MKNSRQDKTRYKAFIFGAGKWGRRYLPHIKENYDVLGYLDNDVNLWHSKIDGVEVFPPSVVEQREFDAIIIAINMADDDKGRKMYRAISKQLLYYKVEKSKIISVNKLPKPFNRHHIDIHLTEHCNLNCAYCTHYSNIAKEEFINIELFEKDLKRLSELTDKDVNNIFLLGGEPLLHPEVIRLIDLTRKHFNRITRIALITNGILLSKQPPEFWECVRRNGVIIEISQYPVRLDINRIKELSVQYSVTVGTGSMFDYFMNVLPKPMLKTCFDLAGNVDIVESFNLCSWANECITLKKGRLYTCPNAAHSEHFFDKFGFLKKCAKDSIDIHKVNNAEELINFISKPIPFCRFCGKVEYGLEWKQLKGEISEWT